MTVRRRAITISPGFRGGWNAGDTQTIVGMAIPIALEKDQDADAGLFAYFSYELPFNK